MSQSNIDTDIKIIASDTNTPPETVSKMYRDTWSRFSEGALVTDYMEILVAKRVRANLQPLPGHRH
jgi:hypothetical protein